MKYSRFVLLPCCLLFSMSLSPNGAPGPSLCKKPETVFFNCQIKKNIVSVCYGKDNITVQNYAQYRHGVEGKTDLVFPESTRAKIDNINISSTAYGGGGETHLNFLIEGYEYILYDRMIRTGFGPDGLHNPKFSSGVVVKKNGKTVSNQKCHYNSGVDASAYNVLPRTDFVPIDE